MQNKNLKLKLGLCGLALTSFLAVNAHSVVHADTVQDSNANNNAITWDSDSDDSQVVKAEPQQAQPAQNVQAKQIIQAPAVQKVQSDQPQKPVARPSRQAPVQSNAQVRLTQPVQNNKVMVSNVSSSAPVLQKRAETSIVRQSNTDTNTVDRLNVDNHQAKTVKVSNIDSDAQAPVQTQVIAKLSPKAKTYVISIPTADQTGLPASYDGASSMLASVNSDFAASATFKDGCWIYDGKIYTSRKSLDDAGILDNESERKRVATVNPEFMMNGTQFLTDMGVDYNNHRLGLLVIPKFTRLDSNRYYQTTNPNDYVGGADFDDIRTENSGYVATNFVGLLPTQVPAGHIRWTDSSYTTSGLDSLTPYATYSYTVVPIDMNTGDVLHGVSIAGTATEPSDIKSFTQVSTKWPSAADHFRSYAQTHITGATVSTDQNLVSPYIKTMLQNINNGTIKPYNYSGYASGVSFMGEGRPGGDYSNKSNMFGHYSYADEPNLYDENGKPTTSYQFEDNVAIPYAENLLYAAVKTREVNPQDSRAHKSATRVISVNLPDDPAVKDRYKGILNSNDQIVQTINFTRTGTENIADGVITWGKWSGPSSFPSVTLPDIPGYTITMG